MPLLGKHVEQLFKNLCLFHRFPSDLSHLGINWTHCHLTFLSIIHFCFDYCHNYCHVIEHVQGHVLMSK